MAIQLEEASFTLTDERPQPRRDGTLKVTGEAVYAADLAVNGLLHGRPVLSPFAHARIMSVDASAALKVGGVLAVLTADDLPVKVTGGRQAEPLARGEVVFAGQPVALVVAETEAAAADGAEAVVVDYEELPAAVGLDEAMAPGAPPARVGVAAEGEFEEEQHTEVGKSDAEVADTEELSVNVVGRHANVNGDVDAAFAECPVIVEGRFTVPWIYQAHLEPQVAVAWPEGNGGLAVFTSTQGKFFTRQRLAQLYDLPLTDIRVEAAAVGGGFGAKIVLIDPLVAGAALALQRPVRVAFTRSEDFAAANPAPSYTMDVRIGARADGSLHALKAKVVIDAGSYAEASAGAGVIGRMGGLYRWENWDVRAYGVRTNRVGSGAYRGPGAPQAAFALESLIDELAEKLGIDPIEIRRRNAVEAGDTQVDGLTWAPIGLREVLDAAESHPLWQKRDELPENEGVGLGAGLFPGARQGAAATCRMDADGGITILSGYIDLTGTDTSVVAIAAQTFGIDVEQVRMTSGDTGHAPHAGMSGGSMVTYCLGEAVRAATEEARTQTLVVAGQELGGIDPSELEIIDGEVRSIDDADQAISLAAIGARVTHFGPYAPIEGHGTGLPPELAPSAAVALVHTRVDPETGDVTLLDWVALQDVGNPINRSLCAGQMRGGAAQGIGYALYEGLEHDEWGQLVTGSFLNYALPTMETVPPIETVLVEVRAPYGPFGAKGIGESAAAPGAGAIANAVAAAAGVRMRDLPMTRERVWRAIADLGRTA